MSEKEQEQSDLNLKIETFCQAYAAIGTKTFSRAKDSALAAGYAEGGAANTATKLLRNPDVQKRILALHREHCSEAGFNDFSVLATFEHVRRLAVEQDKLDLILDAAEDQAKVLSMFTDKIKFVNDEQVRLDASRAAEAHKIANYLLLHKADDIESAAEKLLEQG